MNEPVYQFEDVTVDSARFQALRAGVALDLEPKALEVLLFLIERRERLVLKEELLDGVWRDTFVTPNALTRVIAQLRKALGDDAQEARVIETVPRKGYRFLPAVSLAKNGATPVVPSTAHGSVRGDESRYRAANARWPGAAAVLAHGPAARRGRVSRADRLDLDASARARAVDFDRCGPADHVGGL